MRNTLISAGDSCAMRDDAAGIPAASLPSLAAAPTFVVMTFWSIVGGGPAEMMCSSGGSALSLNGMAAMYALMSLSCVAMAGAAIRMGEGRWRTLIGLPLRAEFAEPVTRSEQDQHRFIA